MFHFMPIGDNIFLPGNGVNTKEHIYAVYRNAVQFFAFLCKEYSFNPLDSSVIMSH